MLLDIYLGVVNQHQSGFANGGCPYCYIFIISIIRCKGTISFTYLQILSKKVLKYLKAFNTQLQTEIRDTDQRQNNSL